jgi:hypothetical protein
MMLPKIAANEDDSSKIWVWNPADGATRVV